MLDAVLDQAPEAPQAPHPASVLVVDDLRPARNVLAAELEDAGFAVTQAADGIEAWQLFRQREPKLVITDVSMPRSDGLELLGRIRECSDVPVILFSAFGTTPTIVSAIKGGAAEFDSSADLDVEALVQLARKLCARHASESSRAGWTDRVPGSGALIVRVRERLAGLAPLRSPVLLTGEPGSGKTTAARALHEHGCTSGLDFYKFDASHFEPSRPVPLRGFVVLHGVERFTSGAQQFWASHLAGRHGGIRSASSRPRPCHWSAGGAGSAWMRSWSARCSASPSRSPRCARGPRTCPP